MDALPMAAPSCSLSTGELEEQLARYRVVGAGAEVIAWGKRRRIIRVAAAVPDALVDEVVQIERACCPFFELAWDRTHRRLTISVAEGGHEPALDVLGYALGVREPAAS